MKIYLFELRTSYLNMVYLGVYYTIKKGNILNFLRDEHNKKLERTGLGRDYSYMLQFDDVQVKILGKDVEYSDLEKVKSESTVKVLEDKDLFNKIYALKKVFIKRMYKKFTKLITKADVLEMRQILKTYTKTAPEIFNAKDDTEIIKIYQQRQRNQLFIYRQKKYRQ